MKKLTFMIALFLFGIGQTIAQKTDENAVVVYSDDGSIFVGKVLQESENELKLVLRTLDTIQINKKYINKIKRAPEDIILHKKGKFHYTKGIFASFNAGGTIGENTSLADLTLGYRLNNKFSFGLGVGIHSHFLFLGDFNWISYETSPLYAYGRYYHWDNRIRPFIDLKLGHGIISSISWPRVNNNGFYAEPGIGLHFPSRRNMRFTLTLSQVIQHSNGNQFSTDSFQNEIEYSYNIWINRTALKVGVEFR